MQWQMLGVRHPKFDLCDDVDFKLLCTTDKYMIALEQN